MNNFILLKTSKSFKKYQILQEKKLEPYPFYSINCPPQKYPCLIASTIRKDNNGFCICYFVVYKEDAKKLL